MKKLLSFSFSKVYIIAMILISLLVVGGYFSYAMFTVSKERSNAISIVTGNLIYDLTVDGEDKESLVVPAGTTKVFTVTLSNPNNRIARFNFYYLGTLPDGVSTGYSLLSDGMVTPVETGINLEKEGTSGSSNTYRIVVVNDSENEITINLGVSVGLDYNDLSLPSNGHLFEPVKKGPVGDVVVTNPGENGSAYDDEVDTFLTGEEPDNYIWYSGKLWRAVSVNDEDNTVKLVTEWNISAIPYSSGSSPFSGSHMEMWLNDTSVDGFLYNLRDYENFLVSDAKWDDTPTSNELGNITRPNGETTVTDAVGLLNLYEYQMSFRGTTYGEGYLNNKLQWWLITPDTFTKIWQVNSQQDGNGNTTSYEPTGTAGIRPSIVLKSNIKIIDGDGTENNPYRLEGDNDTNLSGVLLSSRYSGEYMTFGNDENNLYRIVSHETSGLTKITSAEPLKSSGTFITSAFSSESSDRYYSSSNVIGTFLNKDYLNSYVDSSYNEMIEESTTWYLGNVATGENYKLAKYAGINMATYTTSTKAKIGLLRMGELMSGQFTYSENNTTYWLLTLNNTNIYVRTVFLAGNGSSDYTTKSFGIKPSLNLKSNVIITGGDGTKNNPFTIELG